VARSKEKAEEAKHQVQSVVLSSGGPKHGKIIPLVCDHSSLKSVHQFAADLRDTVKTMDVSNGHSTGGHNLIDVICLNAAMITPADSKPQFTNDDMEITFQTNHVAPFLIMNLIHDLIAPGGRVVVTSSGLHNGQSFHDFTGIVVDPATGKATPRFDTLNGNDFHYKKTYALSKLCNTAFCMALNRRLETKQRDIVANCFTPGLITTTGLFRHQNQWLMPFFTFFANNIMSFGSTVEWGGGALAWMAVADEAGKQGGQYWKSPAGASHRDPTYGESFCASTMSTEATSEENQERLWALSAELAGISKDLF
jgi:protochlorophyllide reductase